MRTSQRMSRKPAENLLVPQGGFEPSTYRLRSDCSAVELLRRPGRALYQTSIIPDPADQPTPVVPAQAGTHIPEPVVMGPRLRGDDGTKTARRIQLTCDQHCSALRPEQRANAAPAVGGRWCRLGRGLDDLGLAVGAGIVG